jgi:hypothetical protein
LSRRWPKVALKRQRAHGLQPKSAPFLTSDPMPGIVAFVRSKEAAPQLLMQGAASRCGIGHTRRAMHGKY